MDSLPPPINNNSGSRPEIDHSKSSDNQPPKLNMVSHSEPMHYDYRTANKLQIQNNENISSQPKISHINPNKTLKIDFAEFVHNRQFSFEINKIDNLKSSHTEGFEPIDDNEYDYDYDHDYNNNDRESSVEPSPTPIVSDLEELLADTPNMQRISNEINSSRSTNYGPTSFPVHGISIPYDVDSDNDESDTPEPCDTPIDDIQCCHFQEMKLSSEDESNLDDESGIDFDEFTDAGIPGGNPALSPKSKSWQKITMTKMNYKRCKKIKCITPITQEMAEWNLSNMQLRRRSVANITPSVHRLFKLDADLLKIREEYLKRATNNSQDSDSDEDKQDSHNDNTSDQSDHVNDNQHKANKTVLYPIKEDTDTKIETLSMESQVRNVTQSKTKTKCNYNVLSNKNLSIVMSGIFITLGIIYYFVSKNKKQTNPPK